MTPIAQAIEKLGGPTATARALAVSPQAVAFWRDGLRKPQPHKAVALAQLSGVPRWKLLPESWGDIWPELIGTPGAPAWPPKRRR